MSLRKITVDGIKWQVGAGFVHKIISFVTTIIIARILGPSNYGLFALALVIINAFSLFKSMGIESALIQRKNNIEEATGSAFFMIPLFGVSLYVILYFSAPTIGSFLNNKEIVNIIRILGIIFVFHSFSRVPLSLLERDMKFNKISIATVVGTFVFSVIAVILAILGYGVWSLVFAYIGRVVISTSMIWVFTKWKPRFNFNKKIAIELFNFGKFIFLGSAVLFLKMNLDNLLVGKLLGVTMLGLYAVSFNISNFCVDYFGSQVDRVTYPAYAKLQNNVYDLKAAFLRVLKHIAIFVLPFGMGIFILGGEFLRFAYGDKWIDAISVLRILAWAGIFNTIPIAITSLFLAIGKPKLRFWTLFLQVIIFFIFITPAAKLFGLKGVGWVVVFASFSSMIFSFFWVIKLLPVTLKEIYFTLQTALVSSFIMVMGTIAFKKILLYSLGEAVLHGYGFLVLFCGSLLVYAVSLFKVDRPLFYEIKKLAF